jgi:hypothetical protein
MKHFHFLKNYFLVLPLLFVACSEDEPSVSNTIMLDGTSFKVTTVSLLGVSIDGEGHAGITFSFVQGTNVKSLTVDFDYSPSISLTGTYSYPVVNNNRLLDDWLTNYTEFNGNTEITSTNLQTGTLTVADHGNSRYTFTIDLKMLDGKVFKGTYKGTVTSMFNNG